MSLQLSGNGLVTGLDSVGSSDLGSVLGSKLDLAGGKILQIVRATDGTNRSTTSTSFVDASISVTIAPQKSDSTIWVIWNMLLLAGNTNSGNVTTFALAEITDNSNNRLTGAITQIGMQNVNAGTNHRLDLRQTVTGFSTPETTSAVTYKGRFASNVAATTATLSNGASADGQLFALEVSA